MIEEWHAAFDGVGHLHAVAQHGQQVRREARLRPEVHRLMHRGPSGKLASDIDAVEESAKRLEKTEPRQRTRREQILEFQCCGPKGFDPGGYETQQPLHTRERWSVPMAQKEPAGYRVALRHLAQQLLNHGGILPFIVVEEHVSAERRVTAKDLITALASQNHLDSRVAYRPAQKELGHAMRIDGECFCVLDRVLKVIREVILA